LKIKKEIERLLKGPDREGTSLTSRAVFPSEFIGFQGHFPRKKILPGVCQVQFVLTTLEKGLGRKVALKEIVLAKFFSPVLPGEELACVLRDIGDGGPRVVKAVLSKETAKVAELKLRVDVPEGGPAD
jgi:3-hydroxyacyl-[acyl-carrier-protein] dehydratase